MKNKGFEITLAFAGLFVAGCAAFFSIKGIGMLFAGATLAAMVMASSLEVAKIVLTSFLYRFWNKTHILLKVYLLGAVLILMGITSLGIFGFLTSAYQKSASEFGVFTQQIETFENQKKFVQDQIQVKKDRIQSLSNNRSQQENRMSSVSDTATANNLTSLRRLQEQTITLVNDTEKQIQKENDSIDQLLKESNEFDKQMNNLRTEAQHSKDIQTFKFIADAFNTDLNTIVKWFIFAIIIVFDPLAVGLILAYNIVVYGKMNREDKTDVIETVEKEFEKKPDNISKELRSNSMRIPTVKETPEVINEVVESIQPESVSNTVSDTKSSEEPNIQNDNDIMGLKKLEEIIDEDNKKKTIT